MVTLNARIGMPLILLMKTLKYLQKKEHHYPVPLRLTSRDFTKWIVRSLALGQLNKKSSEDAENRIDDWEDLAMVKDYLFW